MQAAHLLFDLDNTLYPSTAAIDQGITRRMIGFVANLLNIDLQQAERLRAKRLPFYGTTLEWLKTEHGLEDVESFFSAVHPPEELDEIPPDPKLRPLLQSLGLPMTILTNAPLCHAQRVLEFLNVADLFVGIHDIQRNGFKGKPYPDAYLQALSTSGFTVEETVFFDDHKKYTKGYQDLGGQAVLIQGSSGTEILTIPAPQDNLLPQLAIESVYQVPKVLDYLTCGLQT